MDNSVKRIARIGGLLYLIIIVAPELLAVMIDLAMLFVYHSPLFIDRYIYCVLYLDILA